VLIEVFDHHVSKKKPSASSGKKEDQVSSLADMFLKRKKTEKKEVC
jgi:hypothetical protein